VSAHPTPAAVLAAAAALLPAAPAAAVEIYASDYGANLWVVPATPVVHYHVAPAPPPVVRVVMPADPPEEEDLGMVEVGFGWGGFYMPALAEPLLSAPRAHLALVIDPVSVNFDLSVATDLEWGARAEDGCCEGGPEHCGTGELVQASLGFAWRFNRRGILHPTVGAALELATLDPEAGDDSFAFTSAVTAGLIFEYPLPYGALEAGVDLTGHIKLVAQNAYPLEDPFYLTFGGYVGYRF
jgi:hypothetical protein